jgi:4-hydroxy-3-polyprenylbenzoate decarboxylase
VNRVVVAITGASGAAIGFRIVERLRALPDVEIHLVVSEAAARTLAHEVDAGASERVKALAHRIYDPDDIGATIASGSFATAGMLVAPCSMHTLAAVCHGIADSLIVRAADVHLKERRRLVLLARETPLHLGHLRNMTGVTEMGAIVMPAVPAFYHRPLSVAEVVDDLAARAIDLLHLPGPASAREWAGDDNSAA